MQILLIKGEFMLRSLLVGLDGSADCAAAIDLGIRWAKQFDILLVAIGVVDEPTIRGSQPAGRIPASYRPAYDQLLKESRRNVEQTLEKFAIRCSEERVACKLLEEEGQPCERILMELQRYDLLILGCKTHFTYGSERRPCVTLEHVLRNSPRPVVVVPQPLSDKKTHAVVVAYDGSLQSARALQSFLATGLSEIGAVHIVSVHAESAVEAARTADHAAEFLRFHDVESVRVPIVAAGSPSKPFLDYATEHNAALIVMGAYGQPRISEFFLGSATCDALQNSSIPLLLYH